MDYKSFLHKKIHFGSDFGFDPVFIPDYLFDFQKALVEWAIRKGRGAIFADCGLGKTIIQLVWAENIIRKTNENVLIITPLSVNHQTIREAEKFGIEAYKSKEGKALKGITVTNYERLHLFNPEDFIAVVCDESSILKNFDGARRKIITEFMKKKAYRLLCTATAAPNDYIELGTSSEALGELGYMDMLSRFFKNEQSNCSTRRNWAIANGRNVKWRFKKHAEKPFWRWVCSWARVLRKPSDMGFEDGDFILPSLIEKEIIVSYSRPLSGRLIALPAVGLREQREERRATLVERCEKVAERVDDNRATVVWCHLNTEGDLLEKLILDGKQVKGGDSDDRKEERFIAFSEGKLRVLITKPRIGAFGLNWQHCSHVTFFPSHSYEQYYQGVRRCWRFGQKSSVIVDIITTRGELSVLKNLQRKAEAADKMFSNLNKYTNEALKIEEKNEYIKEEEMPEWL